MEIEREDGTVFECDYVRYIPYLSNGTSKYIDCPVCVLDCLECGEQCKR